MKTVPGRVAIAGLLAFLAAAAPAPRRFGVDEKADAVLRRAADFYASARTLEGDWSSGLRVEIPGQKPVEDRADGAIRLARPDKVAVTVRNSGNTATAAVLISDGKQLYEFIPLLARYTLEKAPATVEGAVAPANAATLTIGGTGGMGLIRALLSDKPYDRLLSDVWTARYVGTANIAGVPAEQVELVRNGGSRVVSQLYVATGDRPLVLRMTSELTRLPPRERAQKTTYTCEFSNWKVNEDLPADSFAIEPPTFAKKVESFSATRPTTTTATRPTTHSN